MGPPRPYEQFGQITEKGSVEVTKGTNQPKSTDETRMEFVEVSHLLVRTPMEFGSRGLGCWVREKSL